MMRNLKALGLALMAVLAMGAVIAASASAEGALFTPNVGTLETAKITGGQTKSRGDGLSFGAGLAITCETAKLSGTAVKGEPTVLWEDAKGDQSTYLTLTPKYENCHVVFAGITKAVTVTMNGCFYVFNATKNTPTGFAADLTIECIEQVKGQPLQIEIHIYKKAKFTEEVSGGTECTYDIKPQHFVGGITLKNNEGVSPDNILAGINLTIPTVNTIKNAVCGLNENENPVYKGEDTLQGTTEGGTAVKTTVS